MATDLDTENCISNNNEVFLLFCLQSLRNIEAQLNPFLVKVKVTLRLTVGQSVSLGIEPHLGLMTRYLLFLRVTVLFCGAPSLTRGRVSPLYMLLALASAVPLGSESLGSRDHTPLSQFWDLPPRRPPRLAGSRWRYSTPPPHGSQVKVKVKVMLRPTVQSASLSWNKAPIWGLRPDLYYCQTIAGLLKWGALSDERTGLSFARIGQQ
jgi:hypothetical protein